MFSTALVIREMAHLLLLYRGTLTLCIQILLIGLRISLPAETITSRVWNLACTTCRLENSWRKFTLTSTLLKILNLKKNASKRIKWQWNLKLRRRLNNLKTLTSCYRTKSSSSPTLLNRLRPSIISSNLARSRAKLKRSQWSHLNMEQG